MIFGWLGRLRSFGDKLTWLLTLTSGGAIVAVCTVLALLDYYNLRRETVAALTSHSMIVAMNSGAPLAFEDPLSASEVLQAFDLRPAVLEATLFDVHGEAFASYPTQAADTRRLSLQPPGERDLGRWYVLSVPIEDREQALGRLQVVYDLGHTRARLWRNLLLSALVTAVAVLLVYLFSRQIKDVLMRPIATLSRTAQQVSATADYGLRAEKVSDDELGSFTDTFNEMLTQIQQQDRDLQAARADAEAASRLKDEFLATLSHELRTPLTPILGWAQILHRIAGDNPRLQQAADVIERSARSQAQIVDDLLDMSRIISGKLRLELQPLLLAQVVDAALETVRPAAEAKGVGLLRDYEDGIDGVRGDPHRLQQVIWNLVSNAIKFTERGGRVEVRMRRGDRHVEIAVRDSGQGISPEFLPHVFERFRQADSSTTRVHGGLGLGLAIARQLVELHGGSLRANSAGLGHGATFTVLLPMGTAVEAGRNSDGSSEVRRSRLTPLPALHPQLAGLRVLLLEHDRGVRETLQRWLAEDGVEVLDAAGVEDALARLEQLRPDLLIADAGEGDGCAFLRRVRTLSTERGGDVPAIALTTFARSEERTRALLAGFQLHVAKPVEQAELRAAIASLVQRVAGEAHP
jgi:signal transduction histidine kinase/ActR/RegA family two-component response regulator